jgi:hypothetical protein
MRLRAIHFASLLLLLAAIGSAEGSGMRNVDYTLGGHYISVLLAQHEAATSAHAAITDEPHQARSLDLPTAALAQYKSPWTMRPPSAHSVSLHAVTGSSL